MKQSFQCGVCGTKYDHEATVECCAMHHKMMNAVVECSYSAFGEYPHKITVRFSDGITKGYVFERLI